MAAFGKTYESWSPAYNATVTNPNWNLTRSATGVTLTHTGTTPDALDGWIIIPVPVLNNTVGFDRGPVPTAYSFRLALQNSASLNTVELWDSEKSVVSTGLPPGPGGPRDGPADGSAQTIELGLLPGQAGEIKIGATVAAHLTFKETVDADEKNEVRLVGAGVAFALVDPSIPETPPIGPARPSGGASGIRVDVETPITITVK